MLVRTVRGRLFMQNGDLASDAPGQGTIVLWWMILKIHVPPPIVGRNPPFFPSFPSFLPSCPLFLSFFSLPPLSLAWGNAEWRGDGGGGGQISLYPLPPPPPSSPKSTISPFSALSVLGLPWYHNTMKGGGDAAISRLIFVTCQG